MRIYLLVFGALLASPVFAQCKPEAIRDTTGKVIAETKCLSGGRTELRTPAKNGTGGKSIGVYDPKSNSTRTDKGRVIGPGNQLFIPVEPAQPNR